MILEWHRQGMSVSAIARQSGLERKTVRKYIHRGLEAPAYGPRKPRQTVIDPFTVEVHTLADEIRIFEEGELIAAHPVLEGRHQRRVAPGHRKGRPTGPRCGSEAAPVSRTGDVVAQRSLEFYDAVARHLARETRA